VAGQINPGNFWGSWGIPHPWYCGFVLQDQNQDGHLDVVLVTRDAEGSYQPTGWVHQGDGQGHFGMNGFPQGDSITHRQAAAGGDFDGDGYPDLVVADLTLQGVQTVAYWGGDPGSSRWAWPTDIVTTTQPPGRLVTGDWDEDGHLDAACLVPALDLVLLLPGNGDGTFGDPFTGLPFPLGTGDEPRDLLAADLDGDGHLDLATANRADDTVSVFLGDGAGHFSTEPPVPAPGGPRALAAGDFDGDGRTDLATAGFDLSFGVGGTAAQRDQICLLLADGRAWGLDVDSIIPLERGEQPVDLVAADFDGDGDVDLAYLSRALTSLATLANDGEAGFTRTNPARYELFSEPAQLEVGDFDADGRPDVAAFVPFANHVAVFRNVAGD
jgi:hypothetical protein